MFFTSDLDLGLWVFWWNFRLHTPGHDPCWGGFER